MSKLRIHVVGGRGKMGTFLTDFLHEKGYDATISGKKLDADKITKADVIFITVPISASHDVILKIAAIAPDTATIIDLSSVMTPSQKAFKMIKQKGFSMHFLFGPSVSSIASQTVVVDEKVQDNNTFPLFLFVNDGARLIHMSPEKHDKTMAVVQNLTHFINISFAKTISEDLMYKNLITPSFLAQLSATNRVLSQEAELLSELQMQNMYGKTIISDFLSYANKLLNSIGDATIVKDIKAIQKKFIEKKKIEKKPEKKNVLSAKNRSIAYLGPEGTYSHVAADTLHPQKTVSCNTIYDVFMHAIDGKTDLGIVPAQNTIEGAVRETFDLLAETHTKSIGAVYLPIHHMLASQEHNAANITHIYSHPQALGQCRKFLLKNFSFAKLVETESTLAAVNDQKIKRGAAFILSEQAAKKHNLTILERNIEDEKNNTTRFFIITKRANTFKEKTPKTILFLSIYNRVGVLKDILTVFANENINLSNIESRPSSNKSWDYNFFIEVEVSCDDEKLSEAVNILKQYCPQIKILGGVN